MRRKTMGTCMLGVLLICSACTRVEAIGTEKQAAAVSTVQAGQPNSRAEILKVHTDLQQNSGWWVVPKGKNTMTITAEANNTDTVLFWLVPTGTQTWGERELLGYDKDGSDGWSFTWEFGDRSFHDHLYVQALGSDGSTLASETINLTSESP